MVHMFVVGAALTLGVTAVVAQSDPISQRRALMKANSDAARAGAQMVKGEAAFDLNKAKEILQTFAKTADTAHSYFPENSKTGGETRAAPRIWENQADFRKRFDDWSASIKQASAQVKDLDSFKQAFGTVTKACDGCHEPYRLPRR
jgi:cytochrome c556